MSAQPLLELREISGAIELHLERHSRIFRSFLEQDSGNRCYGVESEGTRFFVKTPGPRDEGTPARIAWLDRAASFHARFSHPALPRLLNTIATPAGPALVYEWVEGESLAGSSGLREDPGSAHSRFRALPVSEITSALDTVYDLHALLAADGIVASDFYDGCLIYDFAQRRIHICDLDDYRDGPFILAADRNFGSTRFMAPEEFQRGAHLDQTTTVFNLARALFVFLADGTTDRTAFRGPDDLYALARRACHPERDQRHANVGAFIRAWRELGPT